MRQDSPTIRRAGAFTRPPGGRALVFLLLLTASATCDAGRGASPAFLGQVLDQGLPKPDFTLTDTRGRPFDFRARTRGRLALLYFGYTYCPDVCPVQMANVAAVLARMPPEVVDRTSVVFVTVDPGRDTPQRLRRWLDGFSPDFVGLRGTEDEVGRIERALGIAVAVRDSAAAGPGRPGAYGVGHAAQLLAFTPDDSAHVAYAFGTRQPDLAHDLPRLLATFPGHPSATAATDAGR